MTKKSDVAAVPAVVEPAAQRETRKAALSKATNSRKAHAVRPERMPLQWP